MSNLRYKLEALLFSSARSMKIEELCNLTKASPEEVREKLSELKKDYEQRDSSITLIDEGDAFKLNVKSEHISVIQQIVTETELSKTLMETLAVIAFKYPIKQSELIKIRTNKAYDHLRELEEMGYITRQKYGRSKLIKLTPKFFEYFDLPPEKLKEKFENFEGIAKAIKEKEEEIKKIKEDMKKKAEEAGKKDKKESSQPEIDLIDKEGHKQKLEVYEETEKEIEQQEAKEIKPYEEKLGDLEVTDVVEKEGKEESEEQSKEDEQSSEDEEQEEKTEEPSEEETESFSEDEETEETTEEESEQKPKISEEAEDAVDKRVEELLHPKETEEETEEKGEEQEKTESEEAADEESSEEPKDLLEASDEEQEQKPKKRK